MRSVPLTAAEIARALSEAQAHRAAGRREEAYTVCRVLIDLAPDHAGGWTGLGVMAVEDRDWQDAVIALSHATRLAPAASDLHFYLGVAHFNAGALPAAEAAFARAVALKADHALALHNLGAVQVADGRPLPAREAFERALRIDPTFAASWIGLADTYRPFGETAAVIAYLERALALNPDNPHARHMLAAARGETPAPSWRYVAELFDGYAARFDTHLTEALQYVGHTHLSGMLMARFPDPRGFSRILDLGCGTGLMGIELRRHWPAAHSIGVDLSQGMLAQAKLRGCYTDVIHAEAMEYLATETRAFDLMTATDVFGYMGDLRPVLAACARCLTAAGVLAFLVKPMDGEAFELDSQGYYRHARSYVLGALTFAGLSVVAEEYAPFRHQAGKPEPALYLIARR